MIIAKKQNKKINKYNQKFYKYYFFFSIFILIITTYVFFNLGIWENYKKNFFYKIHNNGIVNYKHIPKMIIYGLKKNFYTYRTIYVDMNQRNKIKIEKNRMDKINFINSSNAKNVGADYGEIPFISANATIKKNDKNIKTRIRLKGDRGIHYKKIKNSSYKFNLRGKETFLGVKKFSIQKPRIRNYLNEWIFHELMAEGNLIKLKYKFMYFNLNGENMGLYAFEEGFGKELLERNGRRNGPIFSIDETYEQEILEDSKFEIYDDRTWLRDENINIVKKGSQNLKELFAGEANVSEIIDIKKWAWFFAVVDLTYTEHGAIHSSVKFYYNPVNGKFEPVPYDGHKRAQNYSKHLHDFDHSTTYDRATKNRRIIDKFLSKFFYLDNENKILNKDFYFEYINAIHKISSKKFLDNFFNKREEEINKITSAIYTDSFIFDYDHRRNSGIGLYYFDKNDIYFRANKLLNLFAPQKNSLFIENNENEIIVNNKFTHNINLKLSTINCNKDNQNANDPTTVIINIDLDSPKQIINKEKYLIKNLKCNSLSFVSNVNEISFDKGIDKFNCDCELKDISKTNYKKYFISEGEKLFLNEEIVNISENILIPKDYVVVIKDGQKIFLTHNAFIFSKSRWLIDGKTESIYIGGKKNNLGGGILIFDANGKTKINNAEFAYLNGLQKETTSAESINAKKNNYQNDFILFGSINFYNSRLHLLNAMFHNITSEDALNIVNSAYLIENSKFKKIFSDAIDIDFGNGEIVDSTFSIIGNDAIDFSGSKSIVSNSSFNGIEDKIISVGESSKVNILKISGKNSYAGIVSKDSSDVSVDSVQFSNVKIPFSAYQKKSEYSFAKMDLRNIKSNNHILYSIIDENSKIFENKKQIGKTTNNILSIIYENKI